MNAEDIALTAAEELDQLDGHEPWRPCVPAILDTAKADRVATAYIEIVDHLTGETALIYLAARQQPVAPPAFDDGTADRAVDALADEQLGVIR